MNAQFARYALGAAAAIGLLCGCGSALAPAQPGVAQSAVAGRSWMAADAKRRSTLLYVSDAATNAVYVYSYPAGVLQGTLTGFNAPSRMCSDAAGNVFILSGGSTTIDVYAHGGSSPLRTLTAPGFPSQCSVDPTTGNLAVATAGGQCASCVAVFAGAQGTPAVYQPHDRNGVAGCAYDGKGSLFCSAYFNDGLNTKYAKLPPGASKLHAIDVRRGEHVSAGAVQWDGKDLAMAAGGGGTIYRIEIFGRKGVVTGTTQLAAKGLVPQFAFARTQAGVRVVAPTYGSGNAEIGYWNYPAGGSPTKVITGSFSQPAGVALSTITR